LTGTKAISPETKRQPARVGVFALNLRCSARERGAGTGAAGPPTYGQMSGRRAILEQLAQLVAQLWRITVMMHRNHMFDSGLQ
jgi:hypothetical protein